MSFPVSTKEVPFVKLFIPFVGGIACQYWLGLFSYTWINYFVAIVSLCFVLIGYLISSHWRLRWCFGFLLYIFLFFAGAIITVQKPTDNKFIDKPRSKIIFSLLDNPQQRVKSVRVPVVVQYLNDNSSWTPINEKMLIYFDLKDSLALKLGYGSTLTSEITPIQVQPSTNPYQFNFKKYLSNRGISYTAYIKPNEWIKIGEQGIYLKKISLHLRDRLISLFKTSGLSGDELAVASALTLGYQDLLDDELRQVYSSSGAMHILSVSGLHVGILYVLLSFLLGFLDKRALTRIIKAIILLAFLWFFALLTGIPPCVQRSALMFSFMVIGDCISQKSNIYNTIAASAFILLAFNPLALVDVGFQLSYLAVLSIVFFYPYIYKIVYIKNRIIDMVWSLIAVSIAAQLGTFSLSIFYFNQFPNYFLLSNLVAIPLSTIALYLSCLLIIVSPFGSIAGFVGKIFSFNIALLNNSLAYIEKLPFSVSEGLHISSFQLILIFALTISVSIYVLTKRYTVLLMSLVWLSLFLLINLTSTIQNGKKNELVVFDIPKKTLISLRSGNDIIYLDFDTSTVKKNDTQIKEQFQKNYNFFIKSYTSIAGASKRFAIYNPYNHFMPIPSNGQFGFYKKEGVVFINLHGKSIAIPSEKIHVKSIIDNKLVVDYLVIRSGVTENILNVINPKMVIIDRSISKKLATTFSFYCSKQKIPFHLISSQGAFILTNPNAPI